MRDLNFIQPYFVIKGRRQKLPVKSMPGIFRFSVDMLLKEIAKTPGIKTILLFGVPDTKDAYGTEAYRHDGVVQKAVSAIKKESKKLTVMTDVCLCAYTPHGHCGIVSPQSAARSPQSTDETPQKAVHIDNGKTLKALCMIALSHAAAGADYVAPSAMAKNQVKAIRKALDKNGHKETKIMGYSAKFASNFYGPFREIADSAPKFGDRSGYQLNFKHKKIALSKIKDDINEGADIVMVKPALSYLDIISEAKSRHKHKLAAYNVSGEYSVVKIGSQLGYWDEKRMVFEIMHSIKRAGADIIISYHAKDVAGWLTKH